MIYKLLSITIKILRYTRLLRNHHVLILHKLIKYKQINIDFVVNTKFKFKFNCRLHEYIEFNIFTEGLYEKRESWFVKNYIKKDFICIEVGANTGYYTMLLAKGSYKVYSFEPTYVNFNRLLNNIKLNSSIKNVYPYNLGLSSKNEKRNIFISEDCCGNNSYVIKTNTVSSEITTLTGIDCFLNSNDIDEIDFMKIDVEGFENSVIEGSCNSLIKGIIKVVLIEIKIKSIDLSMFRKYFSEYSSFTFCSNGIKSSKLDHDDNYLFVSNSIIDKFIDEVNYYYQ